MKQAVVVLALLASDCQAINKSHGHNHSHSKRMNHDIISATMRDIASREPQVAVLQNKLNKIQSLKPRLNVAKHDIDEMLKDPVVQEDESVKELARRALNKIRVKPTAPAPVADDIPSMARRALDKLYGSKQKTEDENVPLLARKALGKMNGNSPADNQESDEIASLAKKAMSNLDKLTPDDKAELQDLAKKALNKLDSGSDDSLKGQAKKALDSMEIQENARKASSKLEIQELAKKALGGGGGDMQNLARNALKGLEGGYKGGDEEVQTLAKKALKNTDSMKNDDSLQAMAKAALSNINGNALVQTEGNDGIVFKGDIRKTLGHL